MLQSLGTLSALVVVTDTWESPSLPFLDLLCRQKHAAVVALSLECPAHRLVLSCPTVEALIPCTDPPFPEPGGYSVLIVDGASEWLARVGIAHALRSLLRQTLLFGCVVVTFHSDVVCAETLNQLVASSSCWFAVGPGSSVSTLSKRKGGKVVRAFEEVVSWNPHVVKPLDTKVIRGGSLALEDAGDRHNEILPFVKTAVKGKMIFDVEDMKEGDYEDGADEDDPDADLDI